MALNYFEDPFSSVAAPNQGAGAPTAAAAAAPAAAPPSGSTPAPGWSSGSDNPFTDLLNHVGAFNQALTGGSHSAGSSILSGDEPVLQGGGGGMGGGGMGGGGGVGPVPPPPAPAPTPMAPALPTSVHHPSQPGGGLEPAQGWGNVPKPLGTENPTIAANWYRTFGPQYHLVTAADVVAYRNANAHAANPIGFDTWWNQGNRAATGGGGSMGPSGAPPPSGTPPPGTPPGTPTSGTPGVLTPPPTPSPGAGTPPPVAPVHPVSPSDPMLPPGAPLPPGSPPPGAPPPGGTPPPAPPAAPTGPTDEILALMNQFKQATQSNQPDIESMLNPMFARQRQLLQQQLEAGAALTPGRLQSGGFGQNEGQAISDLSGQQSGQLAGALQQQSLAQMQQNTQLMSLATSAGMQKYVTDINDSLQRYSINTNADLQRWLDTQDNVIRRYGIDTNDLLQRYQAQLQLKGVMYSADRSVDAAALHAAAAQAAANAASQASMYNANLQYQLGVGNLNVNREQNMGQFILGLLGLGNVDMNQLNAILAGIPTGNIVVHP